jgi:hypothetical protein
MTVAVSELSTKNFHLTSRQLSQSRVPELTLHRSDNDNEETVPLNSLPG